MTKVLVFESDSAFAGELRTELSKLGCTISVVDDGNAGLQAAASDKPDLILLSIELPRMNGFSVCNKLKKDAGLKDVPLIIMSSESSDETFEQHRKLRTRAEDYVHKPIAFGELLQHIRTFVPLGASGQSSMPPGEGIVIDDEIQISSIDIEDEATVMAPRPTAAAQHAEPHKMKEVDADVDAFIEGGFGRLTKSEHPPAAEANGSPDAPTQTLPKRGRSAAPPPLPAVDTGKLAELERELMAAREEATKLRSDFDARIEAEQQKMEREIEELKGKLQTAGKGGGVSSREFLDLREALNKKDKEILALKESLSKKDKEIFESRDKSLALERSKADLDDRVLAVERELEEAKEKVDSLGKDRDQAKKANEDLKNRLQKAQAETEAKAKELEDAKAKAKADQGDHEAAVAQLISEHETTLARERSERAAALEQAEAARAAALAEAAKDKETSLAEAASAASNDKAAAIAAREGVLKAESDARLAALHRAHQDELGKLRAEHAQASESLSAKHASEVAVAQAQHEEALEEAKKQAEERLAAREAELSSERAAHVAQVEKDREDKLAALAADRDARVALLERGHAEKLASIEKERDERIAEITKERDERIAEITKERDEAVTALEGELTRTRSTLADLGEKKAATDAANDARIASLEADLAKTRAELADLGEKKSATDAANDARIKDLEEQLAKTTTSRDSFEKELGGAKERIAALEAETAAQRADLADTRGKLEVESERATKATAKWEADKTSLDRAKDALAVALAQIEEAENRPA